MKIGRFTVTTNLTRIVGMGVTALIVPVATSLAAETISLDRYLKQVQSSHLGYKAAESNKSGAMITGTEIEMAYAPTVFANVQDTHDAKPNANPSLQGNATDTLSYMVGVGKMFSTGTQAKLSFGLNEIEIKGQHPSAELAPFAPHPGFIVGGTTLEVSHPLWKNRNGRDLKNQLELLAAQAQATTAGETYKEKIILAEGEMAYRRLALANELMEMQQSSTKRFNKLRDWNKQRVSMQLADKTDLLQAEAALAGKAIELRQAEDDLKSASRAFNSLRGIQSDVVAEGLSMKGDSDIPEFAAQTSTPTRLDVQAAKEVVRLTAAKSQVESEKYKPNLEVFGQYTLNGRREYGPPAVNEVSQGSARVDTTSDSLGNKYPTRVIGIRISAPLGGDVKSRKDQALALERDAARLNAEQKDFEAKRDWTELTKRLADSRERLQLARNLEDIQKKKLDHEQTKQKSGRSTTYQVLMFEQDFAASQLNSIRIKAESFELISRMKTFGLK